MITLEGLAAYGADTAAGMSRCMNNEAFYLRLVNMELGDANVGRLQEALKAGDSKAAFEAAHALKGALGNLSLTPAYEPAAELAERLRGAAGPVDTGDLLPRLLAAFEALRAMAD